ncbi:glycosyltransferase family 4 protein [Methanocella arvoryzae]|uniref:Glycosyltransferase (Group 1) n=1 Tax=Methanocella arvoryzae (strain DSM 22066 / NBRC 105507 / MRE50) TaxID=351160 RepID=Q0W7F1_METAR|nr:glycosyltransferase family 4 protein [Methanocella arvoryzae]CAJ35692.1 putative glycosyltransferase (group 1) [Methanocella arvoryzae MRE50]
MGKKIIICCNAYPPNFIGGAELVAHQQAKALVKMGNDVIVFTGDTKTCGERQSLRKEVYDGLTVYRIHLTPQDYNNEFVNFSHPKVDEYFKTLMDDFRPDIVHFHNLIGLSVGIIHIAKQKGAKTVLTLHDHWGFCFKNTIIKRNSTICTDYSRCEECMPIIPGENHENIPIRMRKDFIRLQMHDIDAFISPSNYLASRYIEAGLPREKFNVIWNGIDVERFYRLQKIPCKGRIRFTFIGYFGHHKGINTLIEALGYLKDTNKFFVNLVGSGDQMDLLKRQVATMGLVNTVKFWGRVDNIDDAYRETDVFILPSIWPENQPVTITEAMAGRIPVIASNNGGVSELIDDGVTGYLFKTGDAADLSQKMAEFIKDPGKICNFGENAYAKIVSNTTERQVSKIVELYDRISHHSASVDNRFSIFACCGKRLNSHSLNAIQMLSTDDNDQTFFIVMSSWLQADQIENSKFFWVVGDIQDMSTLDYALSKSIPLLVPADDSTLKGLCRSGNCGLYYEDAFEAVACIELFTTNEPVRAALGYNGKRYVNISKNCI